jgi:hypothetical protein
MKAGGHWLATHEGVNPFSTDPFVSGGIPGAPPVPGAGPHVWRYRFLYYLLERRGEVVSMVVSEFYAGLGYDLGNLGHILARFAQYDDQVRQDSHVVAFLPFTVDPDDGWQHQNYTPFYTHPAMFEYRFRESGRPNATNPPPEIPPEDTMTQVDRDYIRARTNAGLVFLAEAQTELEKVIARLDELEAPPPWWETKTPPYVLPRQNKVFTFYRANGSLFSPSISRNVTYPMDVSERNGVLLRVTNNIPAGTNPPEPWWIRATDVAVLP